MYYASDTERALEHNRQLLTVSELPFSEIFNEATDYLILMEHYMLSRKTKLYYLIRTERQCHRIYVKAKFSPSHEQSVFTRIRKGEHSEISFATYETISNSVLDLGVLTAKDCTKGATTSSIRRLCWAKSVDLGENQFEVGLGVIPPIEQAAIFFEIKFYFKYKSGPIFKNCAPPGSYFKYARFLTKDSIGPNDVSL